LSVHFNENKRELKNAGNSRTMCMVFPVLNGIHSSDLTGDTMGAGAFQRRTQKGIGWKGKTVQMCTGKTPRSNSAIFAVAAFDM
jgi:hypothetical protein